MTQEQWNELCILDGGEEAAKLLELTEYEDEHPEDYNGPCMCKLCQSYGDPV